MTACAFLFPGQASQAVGMGRDIYREYPVAREIFDRADEILGFSLTGLCFCGPEEELRQTIFTQPAVFVHSVAAWHVLAAAGIEPACVAGHSLGEYSALVAARVLEFEEALKLVERRSQFMQLAGEERPGGMVAVLGLEDQRVEEICRQGAGSGIAVAANFNAPGQVAVSGDMAALERVGELAREAGAKRVIPLEVSGAFHSPLMEPAAREMTSLLEAARLYSPQRPVITNVAARPVEEVEDLRRHLIAQITHPVRWSESVQCMARMGVECAAEVGPGAVLKGLVRRIERDLQVMEAGTVEGLGNARSDLQGDG